MKTNTTLVQSSRIMSITDLCELLGKGRITIWRWTKAGILPNPIKVQGRVIGYRESAIIEWLEAQEVA